MCRYNLSLGQMIQVNPTAYDQSRGRIGEQNWQTQKLRFLRSSFGSCYSTPTRKY